jgi:hypothetical protein
MSKTNRELNTEFDNANRKRSSKPSYNFAELEAVVRSWVSNKPAAEELSPFETCNS